jgi:nucleoside-diphosphate-sugar epimerase|tara:strand:- start:3920 stop:4879 length:960 start_codon:yes stop_codon:yes gene_type:complete
MKFLITGGLGFIGTKVIEKLSQEGHKIVCVDNKDTYGIITPNELNKLIAWRTRNWNHKNVSIINGDLLDRDVCLKSFRGRPEIVIHMATYPRAKIVDEDPILGIPKVIDTTTNLLWHASKFDTKKFVYISSSMVYGDFKDGTREESSTKPQNIYGEAKLTGERLTKLFAKRDGLNYVIVRPSGVFGPGDLPDRVVSKFFDKAMRNEMITLHNGENKVDFTYRQDAAYGIIKAAISEVANTSFNITAGNATSLRTLAETIIDITGSQSELQDTGNHKLYPMRGTLDISRAKDLLDYQPKFSLRQGLESYYEWIRQYTGKI